MNGETNQFSEYFADNIVIQSTMVADPLQKVPTSPVFLYSYELFEIIFEGLRTYHKDVEVVRVIKASLNTHRPLVVRQRPADPLLFEHLCEVRERHALLFNNFKSKIFLSEFVADKEYLAKAARAEVLDGLKVFNAKRANPGGDILGGCSGYWLNG
jgi:hypothetical protein